MTNKTTILSLAIIAMLIVGVAAMGTQLYLPKTGYTAATNPSQSSATNPLNIFNGKITNAQVSPREVIGFTSYDANCLGTQQQTECDAGIKTSEYGELNFHYQHSMQAQPCLHMFGSEKVIVDILDSDGNARITRTIDANSMGMHHG